MGTMLRFKRICFFLAALLACSPAASAQSELEAELAREIDALRTNPAAYTERLKSRLTCYEGLVLRTPGQRPVRTSEGSGALKEAIHVVGNAAPLSALEPSVGLTRAAREHAADIGPKGLVSHRGSRGETLRERIIRQGDRYDLSAQSLTFGPDDAGSVLFNLLVDDSVASRDHRRMLLDGRFQHVGIACAPHAAFRTVCVVNLAGRRIQSLTARGTTPTPAVAMPQ